MSVRTSEKQRATFAGAAPHDAETFDCWAKPEGVFGMDELPELEHAASANAPANPAIKAIFFDMMAPKETLKRSRQKSVLAGFSPLLYRTFTKGPFG
ncbi:MAG TPA: hypothetical protein VJP85_00490 [Candidatus Baltobacteraceae bacterium]|nr:hypothetical protein [Candidatus Baltobacteraceae bacterium]